MQVVLDGIPGVVVYIDDICVMTATWEEHVETLRLVLGRLKDANLKVKLSKCRFGVPWLLVGYKRHSAGPGEDG